MALLLAILAGVAQADTPLELSLEDLMQVNITSVSKKAQRLEETAAAAYVIRAEDIRRAGVTSLPEALRLAPGVQVAALGHNRWSISIRGFNNRFANKLLVLVDGRTVYSPAFSGVFWEHTDLPLALVERIEVIRGPGGSVWGANAVNGIINIITRSAEREPGGLLELSAGDELRGLGFIRRAWALDPDTHLRVHTQARYMAAGATPGGGDGPDYWKSGQAGFRLDGDHPWGRFSVQGGAADYRAGDRLQAISAAAPTMRLLDIDGEGRTAHLLGLWERQSNDETESLQAYFDHSDHDVGAFRYRLNTLDLEYQRRRLHADHDLVWGLGWRQGWDRAYDTIHALTRDSSRTSRLLSAYLQDEITLTPQRWRLVLGGRLEHNSDTGFEVQPSARLLWTPTTGDVYWAALSRAVRTPSRGELDSTVFVLPPSAQTGFLPGAMTGVRSLDSEKLLALDLGWRRQWSTQISTDLALFHYRHDDLRVAIPGAPRLLGADPYLPLYLSNAVDTESQGLELALDWSPHPEWRFQAQAALFRLWQVGAAPGANADEYTGATPRVMASLRAAWNPSPRLEWNAWLRHAGRVAGRPSTGGLDAVAAHTNLDLSLNWKLDKDLRLTLTGQNLLDASHLEHVNLNILNTVVEVERAFHLKLEWKH